MGNRAIHRREHWRDDLFATHYFELTLLAEKLPHAKNLHLSAREHDDQIIFLYAVDEGPASQSYGLQVAKLAGVPKTVLSIAEDRLMQLEQTDHAAATTPHTTPDAGPPGPLQSDLLRQNRNTNAPSRRWSTLIQTSSPRAKHSRRCTRSKTALSKPINIKPALPSPNC